MTDKKIKYINLLTHLPENLFRKQLSPLYEERGIIFRINSDEDIEWDVIAVYENLNEASVFRRRKGGLVFFAGEPPYVFTYPRGFLNQFDSVVSSHPDKGYTGTYIQRQQALPWYFGYDYRSKGIHYSFENIESMGLPEKEKKISFITSNREYLPGHASRMKFLAELQKRYSNEIDFFGKGINEISDKAEGLLPYRFSICIENSSINDYWTEKIADSYLAYSVPVYYGCRNITDYFSEESFIPVNIRNLSQSLKTIDSILDNPEKIYSLHVSALMKAREALLYKYNIYPTILSLMDSVLSDDNRSYEEETVKPYESFRDTEFENKILKYKRVLTRYKDKYL